MLPRLNRAGDAEINACLFTAEHTMSTRMVASPFSERHVTDHLPVFKELYKA